MAIKVETPPQLRGSPEQQLSQVYSFLFRLSENLNVALNEFGEADKNETNKVALYGQNNRKKVSDDGGYDDVRSLIINTAGIIRKEMDVIKNELNSKYVAISDEWGTYEENIQTTIEETAREIIREYDYDAQISGVYEYVRSTSGYIKQGFIDYDAEGNPILGIAIGQNLQYENEETGQLNKDQSCAFYTSEKVSFCVNGQEVAYVSNSKLYIHDMEVTGSVVLGDWLLTTTNGFSLKYIGGDD